ncbi:MAG: hypothetical protein WED82_04980 [Balneolales bacterium]
MIYWPVIVLASIFLILFVVLNLPVKYFLRTKYPTLEYVSHIEIPVLIGHSIRDDLIPFYHGKRLYDAASEPKYWLEMMGDHNIGFIETGDQYLEEIDKIIEVTESK